MQARLLVSRKHRHSFVAFYPSDWRSGTSNLPRILRSAYFDLCCHMWEFASPVSKLQASMILSDLPNASELVDQLVALGKLNRDSDGFLSNRKAIEEGNRAMDLWLKKSSGGHVGASARGIGKGSRKGQKTAKSQGVLEGVPQENEERRTKIPAKAGKKKEPDAVASALPDWLPKAEWDAFIEMRKCKRAAPTDRAIELLIIDLERLQAAGFSPSVVLDQSTKNNWAGLFEPKPDRSGGRPKTGVNRRTFEDVDYGKSGLL